MKDTIFFLIVGLLAGASLTCGLLGLRYANRKENEVKHGDPATFDDLFEDNAPKDDDYPYNDDNCGLTMEDLYNWP